MSAFPLVPLRTVTLDAQTGPFGSQLHSDDYVDGGIPVINPSNIINGKMVPDPATAITEETCERLAHHRLRPGDLVFARRGELGRAAVAHNEADGWLCGTGSLRVRTRESALDSRFAEYVLQSAKTRAYFEMYAVGSTMGNLNTSIVLSLPVPLPLLSEQRRVADFLDVETNRQSYMISLIKQQVKALNDRRQALIDTEINQGEETSPLKYVTRVSYGLGQPPRLSEDGIPILRATNIKRGKFIPEGLIFSAREDLPLDRAPLLKEGEILVVRSGAYTGDSALVTRRWIGSAPGYDLRVTPVNAEPRLIEYCLLSTRTLDQVDLAKSRAAQPHLNAEDLGNVVIPIPQPDEQCRIADFLDAETARIDQLADLRKKQLAVLAEQRQALITAAVTGEITV